MRWQPRRFKSAIVVLGAGLYWLITAWQAGWAVAIIGSIPGVVLIATGGGQLLWAGDRQLGYHMALAGPVSALLAVVLGYGLGWRAALILIAGGAAAFLVAGWSLRVQHVLPAEVPPPGSGIKLLAKVAVDAALLGAFVNCARVPRGAAVDADCAELTAFAKLAESQGWLAHPERMHGPARPFVSPQIESARGFGLDYEWLTAASAYAPDPAWPGASRWQAHRANRQMAMRIFRHRDKIERPWLICIHGYRMGSVGVDFQLFDVARLHQGLGLNLVMPILPLHGSRSATRLTGGLFMDGPLADLIHGQAQALCDLRGVVAWIREQDPNTRIGVLGYSLGGYHAALLAGYEPDLACVIAGIPMTDMAATLWQHMPLAHTRYLEAQGVNAGTLGQQLRPVSPLGVAPQVPYERRFIFAATADQLIAPAQPFELWQHWGRPAIHWYEGSHLSVRHEAGVAAFLERALADSRMGIG